MRTRLLLWALAAVFGGAIVWTATRFFGQGLLRDEALKLAALAAGLLFTAQWIRLVPPADRLHRDRAALTQRGKLAVMLLLAAAFVWGTLAAVRQGVAGYPLLTPDALLRSAEPPSSGFFTAKGRPLLEALYRIGGEDGDRFLVPLDAYEGRLLVITRETPPATPVVVTGRLRTDVRTVQTSAEGQVEGPFVRLYREHMRLPPSTALYFLDTGVRAGLNARALALALVPLWLFLLVWGAPVRRRRRPPMRPLPARLSGAATDQRRGAR